MTRHLLDKTPIESVALAVCLSIAGLATAAHIVRGWLWAQIDRAFTAIEPWS